MYHVEGAPEHIATGQVSVGTSATQIVAARPGRKSVKVKLPSTPTVFFGDSGVTTSNGFAPTVNANGTTDVEFETADALYAIVASGSQNVPFIEFYD